MISIIIPVYNVEKFLPQCLDSILAQSYQDFEVILVDDGSLDNSGNICDEYASRDNRIFVLHQANAGVSSARNNGIERSKGEWITFIDSDDFVTPDYLSGFELDRNDSDLIIQGIEHYNHQTGEYYNEKKLIKIQLDDNNRKVISEECNLLSLGYPVAKAYRTNFIKSNNLRFDTSISFHEDHIFVFKVLGKANIVYLSDNVCYKYRCRHNANSNLSSKRHHWAELNNASVEMIKELDSIGNRYLVVGSDYSKRIYSFCIEPKIQATFEIFRTVKGYNLKKIAFFDVISRKEVFQKYYPNYMHGIITKMIIVFMPFFLIDFYFWCYFKIQTII